MPSTPTRRRLLRVSGATVSVGIAGCTSGYTANGGQPADPSVSNVTATERALAAERSYLRERLQNASCLADWGTTPTTVSKRATVTDRTSSGVYVEVTHPYWYSTDRTDADGGTNAMYLVTEESTRRERGETVSIPC